MIAKRNSKYADNQFHLILYTITDLFSSIVTLIIIKSRYIFDMTFLDILIEAFSIPFVLLRLVSLPTKSALYFSKVFIRTYSAFVL